MIVLDTIARDNGDGGLALVAQDASIVMDHVRSEHNVNVGFYIAPVVPATFAKATITDSVFAHNGGKGIWADTVGGAVTTVLVERTVVANNAQIGFYATAGAAGAFADATLARNSFNGNASADIYSLGVPPGQVNAFVTENSFSQHPPVGVQTGGITADGSGTNYMSGNTGQVNYTCVGTGVNRSYSNNSIIGSGCRDIVPPT